MLGKDQLVFQAKISTGRVGMNEVFSAAEAARHYGEAQAVVVTSASFTDSARRYAHRERVALWNRYELAKLVQGARQERKIRISELSEVTSGEC